MSAASTPTSDRGPSVAEHGVSRHDSIDAGTWSARGVAKVLRDATVTVAELRGTVSIGGRLRAERVESFGRLEVHGAMEVTGAVTGGGDLRGGATLHAGDLTWNGSLELAGSISVDRRLDATGELRAPELSAAEFRADGVIMIPGPVRAAVVELRPRDGSQIGSIQGRSVQVRTHVPNFLDQLLGRRSRVTIGRIESDRVELEGVEVDFVHAPEVVLGPGCHVAAVEGTIVRRHPSSRVGPESRSPAPYGLRR